MDIKRRVKTFQEFVKAAKETQETQKVAIKNEDPQGNKVSNEKLVQEANKPIEPNLGEAGNVWADFGAYIFDKSLRFDNNHNAKVVKDAYDKYGSEIKSVGIKLNISKIDDTNVDRFLRDIENAMMDYEDAPRELSAQDINSDIRNWL